MGWTRGGESVRGCSVVIQAVQIQPLALRQSAAFRRPEHLECTQCKHLVHRLLVPWLVTFLKQIEQGYLDGPGFWCTSPARDNSRSSGS